MNRRNSILVATLGTITLAAAFSVTGATAANATSTDQTSSGVAPQSCWADLATQKSVCVPIGGDLIAAVQDEAGITLVAPVGTDVAGIPLTAGRVAAAQFSPASANAATIVSEIFDDVNYGGGSLYLTAPGAGCNWSISSLGTYGWNDRASSFKSFAGCKTALWQNDGFTGTHVGYSTNLAAFGSFNDQASSWRTH